MYETQKTGLMIKCEIHTLSPGVMQYFPSALLTTALVSLLLLSSITSSHVPVLLFSFHSASTLFRGTNDAYSRDLCDGDGTSYVHLFLLSWLILYCWRILGRVGFATCVVARHFLSSVNHIVVAVTVSHGFQITYSPNPLYWDETCASSRRMRQ